MDLYSLSMQSSFWKITIYAPLFMHASLLRLIAGMLKKLYTPTLKVLVTLIEEFIIGSACVKLDICFLTFPHVSVS